MKELTIEQKAQRYDEAIKKAKYYYDEGKTLGYAIDIVSNIFPELKESEDERMIQYFKDLAPFDKADELYEKYGFSHKDAIAWLEKQGEHANFRNKIQIGDKVTRNEDGVLVNLSQLNRVAKKDEKQGEQNPADKVEPKFREGDWVVYCNDDVDLITGIEENGYCINNGGYIPFVCENEMRLWNITDAKVGDVLACPNDAGDRDVVFIFKNINSDEGWVFCFCASDANGSFCTNNDYVGNSNSTNISPATKEQRDTLERVMNNAGYRWSDKDRKLIKILKEK